MIDPHWALGQICFNANQGFMYVSCILVCCLSSSQRAPQRYLNFIPLKKHTQSYLIVYKAHLPHTLSSECFSGLRSAPVMFTASRVCRSLWKGYYSYIFGCELTFNSWAISPTRCYSLKLVSVDFTQQPVTKCLPFFGHIYINHRTWKTNRSIYLNNPPEQNHL